jgi:hypothetical protein
MVQRLDPRIRQTDPCAPQLGGRRAGAPCFFSVELFCILEL